MRTTAVLFAIGVLTLAIVGSASAGAPSPVPNHQHFLVLPDGTVLPVGPDICINPQSARGFYGFHQNVHAGSPNLFAFRQENNPVGFAAVGGCPA